MNVYSAWVSRTSWADSGKRLTTRVERRSLKSYCTTKVSQCSGEKGVGEAAFQKGGCRMPRAERSTSAQEKRPGGESGRTVAHTLVNGRSSSVMRSKREDV
jgi:hypothetical protein